MRGKPTNTPIINSVYKPLEYVRPIYRTAYKLPLGSSVLHLGQPQFQPFNPLILNELRRRHAVRPLKIKILSKNLGRQRCAEGFNFVTKRLNCWSPAITTCTVRSYIKTVYFVPTERSV